MDTDGPVMTVFAGLVPDQERNSDPEVWHLRHLDWLEPAIAQRRQQRVLPDRGDQGLRRQRPDAPAKFELVFLVLVFCFVLLLRLLVVLLAFASVVLSSIGCLIVMITIMLSNAMICIVIRIVAIIFIMILRVARKTKGLMASPILLRLFPLVPGDKERTLNSLPRQRRAKLGFAVSASGCPRNS